MSDGKIRVQAGSAVSTSCTITYNQCVCLGTQMLACKGCWVARLLRLHGRSLLFDTITHGPTCIAARSSSAPSAAFKEGRIVDGVSNGCRKQVLLDAFPIGKGQVLWMQEYILCNVTGVLLKVRLGCTPATHNERHLLDGNNVPLHPHSLTNTHCIALSPCWSSETPSCSYQLY